jgi:hypothetical protein
MRSGTAKALLAGVLGTLLLAVAPAAAGASLQITSFGTAYTGSPSESGRQAGSHADLTTSFGFLFHTSEEEPFPVPDDNVKDIAVDLPPGQVGNPTRIPACDEAEVTGGYAGGYATCPMITQVGVADVTTVGLGAVRVPVYNVEQPEDLPALFAFNFNGVIARLEPALRPGDGYAISTLTPLISQGSGLLGAEVTLWGVPAAHSHDSERFDVENFEEGGVGFIETQSPLAPVPFLTNSTSCATQPQVYSIRANSWQQPERFVAASASEDEEGPLQMTGCERLPFAPKADVQSLERRAEAPTGAAIELEVPQSDDAEGLATAHVRRIEMALPEGLAISTSAAAMLGACAPDQIRLGSNSPPTCPASSNVGSVVVESPLLDEPLHGDVFLAQQRQNPFGSLFALYVVIEGPGVLVKLPVEVQVDPATGQIKTVADDLPQLPFGRLRLTLKGGPQAPVTTPPRCGRYVTEVSITSWASDVPVLLDAPMNVDQGCDSSQFNPRLRAASANPLAGAFTPFGLAIDRDGGQNLSRLDLTLPRGLLAKLKGVPYCPDAVLAGIPSADGSGSAQLQSPSCPAASQVGTVSVWSGAGGNPLQINTGRAYLAGPFDGGPLSLAIVTPAVAGPFDLGNVVVRTALHVDPVTAQVTAASPQLPQILAGVPLSYRRIKVALDRPGFVVNPTSCKPMQVDSTIFSSDGATASPSARFQVTNCAALAFNPKLAIKLTGPTRRTTHPALRATLKMPKANQANVARAQVILPRSEFLEQSHIRTICTRVQYAADRCPKASVYGHAKAWSPLLDKPLSGPVYLRSSNHQLPDLVASLDGQIHVDLAGRIDSVKGGGIRTTFWAVPDAPVSKFVLSMQGGDKGLLVNSRNLCAAPNRAQALFTGHNGKQRMLRPVVGVGCGTKR